MFGGDCVWRHSPFYLYFDVLLFSGHFWVVGGVFPPANDSEPVRLAVTEHHRELEKVTDADIAQQKEI